MTSFSEAIEFIDFRKPERLGIFTFPQITWISLCIVIVLPYRGLYNKDFGCRRNKNGEKEEKIKDGNKRKAENSQKGL